MGVQRYSASLTAERPLRHETRVAFSLLQENPEWGAVRHQIWEQNLFQARTQRTLTTYLQQIGRRVRVLDNFLQQAYLTGTYSDQNALLLYTFTRVYRLPREFLAEVVRYSWQSRRTSVSLADLRGFISGKAEQDAVVAGWSPRTRVNVQKVLGNFFVECQILVPQGEERWGITPLTVSPALRAYVAQSDRYADFLAVILNA